MLRTEYLTCATIKLEKSLTAEEILTPREGVRLTDLVFCLFVPLVGCLIGW